MFQLCGSYFSCHTSAIHFKSVPFCPGSGTWRALGVFVASQGPRDPKSSWPRGNATAPSAIAGGLGEGG